jgi:hypothetical protein
LLLDDDEQSKDDDSRAEEETETGESSPEVEKGMDVEQQQPLQKEQQHHQDQQELLQQQQLEQQQQHQLEQEQQLLQQQQQEQGDHQQQQQEQQQQVEQQQQLKQQKHQHNVEKREVAEQEVTPTVRLNPRHHLRQAPDAAGALADPSGNTADRVTESVGTGTDNAQSEHSKAAPTELPDISRTDAADNRQTESADVAQMETGNLKQTEPAYATQAVIAESVKVAQTEIDPSSETEPAEQMDLATETESADDSATTEEPPTDVSHSGSIESDGENTEKAGSVEIEVVNGEIVQNALEDNVQNVLESVGEDEKMDKQPSYHKELKGQGETHPEAPLETAKTEELKTTIDPSLVESDQEETSSTQAPLVEKSTGFLGSLFGGFSSDPPAPTSNEQMDPLAEERTFAEGAWSLCPLVLWSPLFL